MKTKVLIIGAGPSGLLLSLLLKRKNISTIILEKQSSEYVANRIRAGILEPGTVKLLKKAGISNRVTKEGLKHNGFKVAHNNNIFDINLKYLANDYVTVYGQTEVTKDLMNKLTNENVKIIYNVPKINILNIEDKPLVEFDFNKTKESVRADFIVGCDGFHGISKSYIPNNIKKIYKKDYSFGWLGILSDTKPISDELIYINNKNGFALCSMRSKKRSRYYLQCEINENINNWSDDRFWDSLSKALPNDIKNNLQTGPSIEKSIAKLRSYVLEPMSYKKLFLAGDAAHIVPPTGAKGLNLALSDVDKLSSAFISFYEKNSELDLINYSNVCLSRVWKTQRFSSWMTNIFHNVPKEDNFLKKLKQIEMENLLFSIHAKKILANNYLGKY
jgi:p-hydroxybenzoate 3-monooxygenase